MSTAPAYDRIQQIFCLNWLSNVAAEKSGDQESLQQFAAAKIAAVLADAKVQGLIGAWSQSPTGQPAWGPAVWLHPKIATDRSSLFDDQADNTMFVARQVTDAGTTLVVSIAGTNPLSWFGWVMEDFAVVQTLAWSDALQNRFADVAVSADPAPAFPAGPRSDSTRCST